MKHNLSDSDKAMQRLLPLIRGEAVAVKPLEQPAGDVNPLEQWARIEALHQQVDLALTLPLALVMSSAVSNGGVRIKCPDGYTTGTTIQHIGQAGSGVGKTTVMRAGRLVMDDGLTAGKAAMAAWVADRLADVANHPGIRPEDWNAVYEAGYCGGGTMLGAATPEGLRNGLSENGSHQVVWTAESDIIEEIGRYSKDGTGSISMFLHGWDGEDIAIRRAGTGMIRAPKASLPMALLIQPETFDIALNGQVFLSKGFLHRTLLTMSDKVPAEPVDTGPTGSLEMSRMFLAAQLRRVAVLTAPVRACRAAMLAWEESGTLMAAVPRPTVVPDRVLAIAPGAEAMYARVQAVRAALMAEAVAGINQGANHVQWHPLAARLTDHVLRVAGNYRLMLDPDATQIEASDLEDALDRIIPWLWEHWSAAMAGRTVAAMEVAVVKSLKDNPKGRDITVDGHLLRAFGILMRRNGLDLSKGTPVLGSFDPPSFSKSAVCNKGRDLLNGPDKTATGAYRHLRVSLDAMIAQGDYVEETADGGYNGHKQVRLTNAGMLAVHSEMR